MKVFLFIWFLSLRIPPMVAFQTKKDIARKMNSPFTLPQEATSP
jgi:hypothetical protein